MLSALIFLTRKPFRISSLKMDRAFFKIFWVSVFSIAMAYLESAVVVYLRRVYGITDLLLQVPPFDAQIAAIEVGRELATLVMLLCIGWIAGKTFQSRVGFTFITFGLWDIFYYIWLRVFIGWPRSIIEPDLLFLIPLPRWGPVLSPVLIALLMVTGGIIAVIQTKKNKLFILTLVLGMPNHWRFDTAIYIYGGCNNSVTCRRINIEWFKTFTI